MNLSRDNFLYAMESSRVIHEPDRRIATFGETRFQFQLISELMDRSGEVRIRSGEMEACKPLLIRPNPDMELEGFGDEIRERLSKLLEAMRQQGIDLAFLQYGFRFRRSEVTEEIVKEPLDEVTDRLVSEVRRNGNPMLAILEGVDDAWEIALMKFSLEMITHSHHINTFDLQRKKLL
ncbi:MAG TPA: hypothetical protein DDW21_01520 [Verrucomicrobiales bacterium]|jgi:hypothetical protein|nr:MAG: hypothetical protein B9S37_03120 [Verrucomicrobiae bacterium Tous-C3TDCM]PAZ06216.1 MAG: hypothetical protein CAK88_04730 [Verrucomicrobiae bacterium AMD-G2]HBE22145.1 hypothetical protein [Verrucomicrobiales bacterium]